MQEGTHVVMDPESSDIESRTASLRAAFDERFRAPPKAEPEATVDVLIVQLGDGAVGILVEHTARLVANPRLARVADARSGCLGVAGHRGRLVAVFDLGLQLGHTTRTTASTMIVSRRDPTVGFAVSAIGAYRRVPRSTIVATSDTSDSTRVGMLFDENPVLVISIDYLVLEVLREMGGES